MTPAATDYGCTRSERLAALVRGFETAVERWENEGGTLMHDTPPPAPSIRSMPFPTDFVELLV